MVSFGVTSTGNYRGGINPLPIHLYPNRVSGYRLLGITFIYLSMFIVLDIRYVSAMLGRVEAYLPVIDLPYNVTELMRQQAHE